MKYFKIMSPPQVIEDLKLLLNQVCDQFEDKHEIVSEEEENQDVLYDLGLSVSQSIKIPQIAELATLPDEMRQLILLIILENRYFLKNYRYELIAAVINSLTKESLPLTTESFIEHYDLSWKQAFPKTGKSKSVWLFHYDCRFWLLLLRIIVRSIEQSREENVEHLCNIAFEQVLNFKTKFKGYGHFPEVSPLIITLIKLGSEDIVIKLKSFCKDLLPKVYNQLDILHYFSRGNNELLCLFLKGYSIVPSEKWIKKWYEVLGDEDITRVRQLCHDLWSSYLPSEDECKKLAHLSGGTLDMEVILGIQRQLYQDFQDMTEYEELGRNITRSAIWGLGFLNKPYIVDDLYEFCKKYNQFNEFCRAAIYALENIETNESLRVLQKIQFLVKNRDNKKAIYSALQKQGARLGFSVDILNDLTTDDCGLDVNGVHNWILGRDYLVYLELSKDGSINIEYTDRESDEKSSTSPKLLKSKYEDEFNSIQDTYNLLEETLKLQINRLEQAMCQQRSWPCAVWKDIFNNNPINNNLACRLLWLVSDKNDNKLKVILPVEKEKLIDIQEKEIELTDNCVLKILHPVLLTEEEIAKWKQLLDKREICSPFKQLEREVYSIDDSEKSGAVVSVRFAEVKVPFNIFQEKLFKSSWVGFSMNDFDESEIKYKDYNDLNWRAYIYIDLTGINIWRLSSEVLLKEIYFSKLEKRGKHFKVIKEKALLTEVDPVVYSETMQDIANALKI
ncbi:MAG: DUF4132 domain-containing protein [Cyanobacteriota bacterium]